MKLKIALFLLCTVGAAPAFATGLATCDSGDKATWQSTEALTEKLTKEGWEVRLVKEDGGCYEVYAKDKDGNRTEAYFHPVTLEPVPIEGEH